MEFDLVRSTEVLRRTPATLRALLSGLADDWTRADEGPDTFSPFEVVGHLIHGEKTDWIPRARIILGDDEPREFVPFDRFAQREASHGKTLSQLLDELQQLRTGNLDALATLEITPATLDRTGRHPELGEVTLRQLLSTWVVHDLGHIAQITRVMAKQYQTEVGPWGAYLPVLTRR